MATVTNFANAFETTLTADMLGTDLTAQVETTDGAPTSPCYLVIDPHNEEKREYALFDGTFGANSFATTALANRYLGGSAAASGITHAAGAIVRFSPVAQHFTDLHGRVTSHTDDADPHSAQFAERLPKASPVVESGALQTTASGVLVGGDANAMVMRDTLGTTGRRVSIEPKDSANSDVGAELQIIPGALFDPLSGTGKIGSEIILMHKTGANYERMVIALVNGQYQISSNANGDGIPRHITFLMGGRTSSPSEIPNRNALQVRADASVLLNGATFTADGKTWGAMRTTLADWTNTGQTRFIFDTRTGTPTDDATDQTYIEFRRGGARKWSAGLNASGANGDHFTVTNSAGAVVLEARQNKNIGLGSGTNAIFAGGVGVIGIADMTTAPGIPVGGGILYVEAGALKYRGSGGTITTLGVA